MVDTNKLKQKELRGVEEDEEDENSEDMELDEVFLERQLAEFDHSTEDQIEVVHAEEQDEEILPGVPRSRANFADIGVDPRFSGKLPKMNVFYPSAVQSAAIPEILKGESIAIQSYTGSGKTLAYILPVLTMVMKRMEAAIERSEAAKKIDPELGQLQAIIVSPSRELSMQIHMLIKALLPQAAHSAVQQSIGGASLKRQRVNLKKNRPMIIVGTPGRLAAHSALGSLRTHNCGILVIDEADQMFLNPQFRQSLLRLIEHIGKKEKNKQTILVSATMTNKFVDKMKEYVPNIKPVFVKSDADSDDSGYKPLATNFLPPNLTHVSVMCRKDRLVDETRRIIHALGAQKALVFMNYTRRLKDTLFKLLTKGMPVAILHGEQSKKTRERVMQEYRNGKHRALIVSDVLARGMDIPDCDLVINMELPSESTHYAHRAGRTGRMGRKGIVVSLCGPNESYIIHTISKKLKTPIHIGVVQEGRFILKENGSELKVQGSKYENANKWEQKRNTIFSDISNMGDEDEEEDDNLGDEKEEGEEADEDEELEDGEMDDYELERDMKIN